MHTKLNRYIGNIRQHSSLTHAMICYVSMHPDAPKGTPLDIYDLAKVYVLVNNKPRCIPQNYQQNRRESSMNCSKKNSLLVSIYLFPPSLPFPDPKVHMLPPF